MGQKYSLILVIAVLFSCTSLLVRAKEKPLGSIFQNLLKKAKSKNIVNGTFEKRNRNNQLEYSITLKNNILDGPAKYYYSNGNLKEEVLYRVGLPDGKYIQYFKKGGVRSIVQYSGGQLNGLSKFFDEKGMLISEYTFLNNFLNGPYRDFYEDGTLQNNGFYKNNQLEGLQKNYYSNGQLKCEETYFKGVQHGMSQSYDSDGRLIASREYNNGTPVYSQQEIEMMKVEAMQKIADQVEQAKWQTVVNRALQNAEQNRLMREQNNIMRINALNNLRARTYSGTIRNAGFGSYNVNLTGY